MDRRELIARRVARELKDGQIVNLGIGIPALVAQYIPDGVNVILHGENGMIGVGPEPETGHGDPNIADPNSTLRTVVPGGCFIDSIMSFTIARGGHLDVTVLGGMQVDEHGNLANWWVPGKRLAGMGGAMDLVVGARQVIVAMEHTAHGRAKILKQCTLPLTAAGEVDLLITELAVFRYLPEMTLCEVAPGVSVDDIRAVTEATFRISPELQEMRV